MYVQCTYIVRTVPAGFNLTSSYESRLHRRTSYALVSQLYLATVVFVPVPYPALTIHPCFVTFHSYITKFIIRLHNPKVKLVRSRAFVFVLQTVNFSKEESSYFANDCFNTYISAEKKSSISTNRSRLIHPMN